VIEYIGTRKLVRVKISDGPLPVPCVV